MAQTIFLILFIVLMLPGFAGVFLPVPGLVYMMIVAIVFGFTDHFQHLTLANLGWLLAILIVSIISDMLSGILGAKYGGAKKQSIYAGLIGMLLGFLSFPPFGGLLGLFFGVLAWEVYSKSSHRQAIRAASASLAGSVAGMAASLLLSLLFVILFIVFASR